MRAYERAELDYLPIVMQRPSQYDEDGDSILVNGMLGKYRLWVSKTDKSVTPCLTGEVGGMPGAWENWVTSWHTKNLPEFDTYIDVGANSGYFTFLAACYGLDVIACEANPVYVDLLSRSITENKMIGKVHVVSGAISDTVGKITLTVPDELHGGASTVFDLPGTEIEVPCRTLDSAMFKSRGRRVLVKIDVEGAEPQVFKGASITNALIKPTYVLEYTPSQYDDSFFDQLSEYGVVSQINGDGNEHPVTKEMANSNEDWITLVVRPR